MENYRAQQEILVVTDSSFVRRGLYQNDHFANNKQPATSAADKFEEACWNGLLRDWLPGINHNSDGKKLFLWKVFVANAFVGVELSEVPSDIKGRQSLNPYQFLSTINNN